jgi:hypothetical protein
LSVKAARIFTLTSRGNVLRLVINNNIQRSYRKLGEGGLMLVTSGKSIGKAPAINAAQHRDIRELPVASVGSLHHPYFQRSNQPFAHARLPFESFNALSCCTTAGDGGPTLC